MSTALANRADPRVAKLGRFKSALLEWLGVPIQLTDGAFWSAWFATQSTSGECVTEKTALRLSAVWACVRLLAQTVATLPLNLYENTANGRVVAREHPLSMLLKLQPNAEMTAVQFWESFMASMLLPGNAFAEIVRRGDGVITALDFLIPQRVSARRERDGSTLYRYIDEVTGHTRELSESDVFHVPAFSLDGRFGLSPIQYGANIFGNAMSADRASGSLFANGMRISGVFEFDHVVKENQRAAFQKSLEAYQGAINAGKSPLLEAGIHYKSITMNAEDAELLASRGYSVEEVCRWYGVPPFMVGHGEKSNAWPASIEQQMIAFVSYSLRAWLKRIEQAISKQLLKPEERSKYYAEFNLEGLLRGDSAARKEWYNTLIRAGVMTRNEAREKENLEPVDGGDVITAEANLVPLSSYEPDTSSDAVDPLADPADPSAVPATQNVQATALNGAQVVALQSILQSVADGKLPAASASAMIAAAFPLLSAAQVSAMVNPLTAFEPTADPVAPDPFGGNANPADDPNADDPSADDANAKALNELLVDELRAARDKRAAHA